MKVKVVLTLWIFVCFSSFLFAQSEEIKIKQRAIFLYNFGQHITWPTSFDVFTIGVLSDNDQIVEALKKMKKRTVQEKPFLIKRLEKIKDIEDMQMVYVHRRLNYDIKDILRQIKGKGILVVSEDYEFNTSMINMINVENSFQFEINEQKLDEENFVISDAIRELAITSSERWQALYREFSKSLFNEREKVHDQNSLIEQQEQMIIKQFEDIDKRSDELYNIKHQYDELASKNKQQQRLYEEKVRSLNSLTHLLDSQRLVISERRSEIQELDNRLKNQHNQLNQQEGQIEDQRAILNRQKRDLDKQRNYTFFFIIISFLVLLLGLFVWINYRIKRRSNIVLALKNEAIENKSRKLQEVNKEMERFAYIASHDLQEPLNTITGWISLIEKDQLDEIARKSINYIDEASERMRILIRGLLEYSKLGNEVSFEDVDCNKVLNNVKSNLAKVIEDNKVELKVGYLPSLRGYETHLTLLFQNLISNAIKFQRKDVTPKVDVSAVEVEGPNGEIKWHFKVSDNGIGISPQHQDKVFEIFHREHGRGKYEGTGIGLAHSKRIVESHGGMIWFHSELGKGTTFYFTL